MGDKLTEIFLLLFCEKNSDGTKKLRLKGNELVQRIGYHLNHTDMPKIVEFLNNHPEVNELNFCYNDIGDEALEYLSSTLFKSPNSIKYLNIMHCDITAEGVLHLSRASEFDCLKLSVLRLAGNKLGPKGAHVVSLMLRNCPLLEYLDIGDTDQTQESIDSILNLIAFSNLKILNISRIIPCHMYSVVDGSSLADSFLSFFEVNNTLVEFHAQKCELDAHDVETMIIGLKANTSLKFLDIGYNNICCVGLDFLSDWIKTRPNLLGLNVAGNKVKNHGAIALSFAMPFSKMRFLDISYNNIGNEGMVAILNSIKKPYLLRYFYFWGNTLGHSANKAIERMLRSGVFEQACIDVKIYEVDGILCAGRYPADHYKHRYYEVLDYGLLPDLKIKRNRIEKENEKPRALVKFQHIDRYPPLE